MGRIVGERGDVIHVAAASAGRVGAEALGAGEGGDRSHCGRRAAERHSKRGEQLARALRESARTNPPTPPTTPLDPAPAHRTFSHADEPPDPS
jgi:hypothetical protein